MKTTSSATTQYFYDPSGHLIQEYVPATGLGTDYVYLDSAPIARVNWSIAETSLGTVLDVSKSGSNAHLDWSGYSSSGSDKFLVERKEVVDTNDKSFTGAAALASVSDPTKTYDDPVIGNGKRYDYRVFKYTRSDTLFYYHTDYLGTPIAMTDGSGTLVWQTESWIANPELKIPNFTMLDPRQQAALINSKWPSDIARQEEQLEILRGLLSGH